MSRPSDTSAGDQERVVRDVACTACGCLCDDVAVAVRGGRIVGAEHACEAGRRWFLADHSWGGTPEATVDGRPAGRGDAVARAAEILGKARAPVVLGLTRTATESVAEALAIADRIGAAVDLGTPDDSAAKLRAFQRVGRVSATLGEVKNRADVVVFWGVDPVATHPRHWERYSVEPRGRFVPEGRAGRTVIVADAERTATAGRADLFVRVAPGAQFEALWVLRALVRGAALDPARVEESTGVGLEVLADLAARLKGGRYGALFFGAGLGEARGGPMNVEAVLTLVRDLNAHARFVALTLGGPGNRPGAESVLTWQSGLAGGVDFARGYPRALHPETSAPARLERGEADAALIVSEDVEPGLSEAARAHLARIPRVVIGPGATARPGAAAVALASATPGIDAGGTVTRTDGVVLPLRPPLAPGLFPSDRAWLEAIAGRLAGAGRGAVAAPHTQATGS